MARNASAKPSLVTSSSPSYQHRHIPSSPAVDRVLQSFNTWAFKREQPSDGRLLRHFVQRAMFRAEPVSFVLYWGKGPRSTFSTFEQQCLAYLESMAARVTQVHAPGVRFDIVYTDTHARLNGHPAEKIDQYCNDLTATATGSHFRISRLADLCEAFPVDAEKVASEPSDATIQSLMRSAMKWYRGQFTPEDGARQYYAMNMIEREVIEHFFPTSIFLTFNGSDLADLFPRSLPIFYMYSIKRGVAVKPWFMEVAANDGGEASAAPQEIVS
jgi:hypothetical protein